jgi:hypothetical protein
MDYIIKNRLQNKYPSILNYNTDDGGYIYLDGAFSKENYIAWKKPKIYQLNYTPNTSFRFIVEFTTSEGDKYSKFYTSEAYYKDLVASQKDNNPYFSKASFRKNTIVVVNLSELKAQRETLYGEEERYGIRVNKNVLFDVNFVDAITLNTHGIDYDSMVEYMDWLIKQQNNYNPDNGGVIAGELLGEWNTGVYNRFTGKYQSDEEFNHFIYIRALEDQLKGIDDVIASLNFLYANPNSDEALGFVDSAINGLKAFAISAAGIGATVFSVFSAGSLIAGLAVGVAVADGLAVVLAGLAALGPLGWAAAALVTVFAFVIGGQSADAKAAEQKSEAIKKYCLEELTKFKKLREDAATQLDYVKKLAPETRKPIFIVNSDTSKLKQTAFQYDDERFQTKNERRIYSANMKAPITFSVEPGTKGTITKKKEVEPDTINVTPDWASITTNK